MKTASVRELRQNFPRILEWIRAGEEVAITRRREAVAKLVPSTKKRRATQPLPDISRRLRTVFGDKIISDRSAKELMDRNRGAL